MRLLMVVTILLSSSTLLRADDFDHYLNPILNKAATAKSVKEIKQLTPDLINDHTRGLPRIDATILVVKTNEGRNSKLLVRSARQKIGEDKTIPILYIDRFVTYKEGEERTILAAGGKLSLFPGFRFSLDLGQVVPEQLGGDLRLVVAGEKIYTEPVGKAKLYLLTAPLPEATPKKGPKLVVGETFEPRYFNGKYKLYDDGRRSGELVLKVEEDGTVSGAYYSDRDGQKYEVRGKIGMPQHSVQFTVKFPRSEQSFQGWLFTGNGKALTGTSRILEREAGFYAVRVEE